MLGIGLGPGASVCGGVKFYGAGKVSIGAGTWIGIGAKFYTSVGGDILIGDRCDIAPEVAFHSGSHKIGSAEQRAGAGTAATIMVGDGCWIGLRATVLSGVKLRNSCVVGAHSLLVAGDYGPSNLIVGAPARPVRILPEKEDTTVEEQVANR